MHGITLPQLTDPDLIIYAEKTETRTKQTYTSYAKNLQAYLTENNYTLNHITPLQCRRFIQTMGQYQNGTYQAMNTAAAYKRFMCALMQGIDRSKVSKWIKQNLKEVHPINHFKVDIAFQAILNLIETTKTDHTNPSAPTLAYAYSIQALDGLRPGEALGHYHTDIDLEHKTLNLQRHPNEKYFPKGTKTTDKPTPLPINEISIALYMQIPPEQKQNNRVVNISYKTMRKWFNRYAKQANLIDQNGDKVTLHKLRHFFGHYFSDHSQQIQILQTIMRHSDLKYTQIYTKPSERRVTEEFDTAINQTIKNQN